MAEIARTPKRRMSLIGKDEIGEEKWAKHYSSNHQILLVGEGDFSFSLSLAICFGSASNIVASSFDSFDTVIKKYKRAKTNLEILGNCGAQILHEVDATKMKLHTDLRIRKFDRIVYNFPHAGFLGNEHDHLVITKHRNLVRGFLRNASGMLRADGEVHVTHKTTHPFDTWNIEELATRNYLKLIECVEFEIEDYPGYENKRGSGKNPDHRFPLGKCSTYKFVLTSQTMKSTQKAPLQGANEIFKEYFNHARGTFGQADYYLEYSVPEMLRYGFQRYYTHDFRKPLDGYLTLLEELWNLSRKRVAFLQTWLLEIDNQY